MKLFLIVNLKPAAFTGTTDLKRNKNNLLVNKDIDNLELNFVTF